MYNGDFVNGKRHGEGTYKYANGTCYTGDFQGGKRHGKGSFTWPDGRKYEGDWVNDIREGHGTMTHGSGHTWEGPFRNNVENGVGIWRHPGEGGKVEPGYRWIDGKPEKFVSPLEALEISSNMDVEDMLQKQNTVDQSLLDKLRKRHSLGSGGKIPRLKSE